MSSPIIYIIAVCSMKDRFSLFRNPILSQLRDNVQLILYTPSMECYSYTNYPINLLRNTAISQVRTTHFLMLDMDAWPAYNLEEEIAKLPLDVMTNPKAVVILPIFFFNPELYSLQACKSIMSCTRE